MIDSRAAKGPGDIEKEGLFTGKYAINPFSGEKVPIWIGNFVLMGYGTGAIMAVPAHDQRDFEFCKQYGIPYPAGDSARGWRAGGRRHAEGSIRGRWCRGKFWRIFRPPERGSAPRDDCQSRGGGFRERRGHLSHQGLGNLAATLLGHSDSGDLLPEVRHRAGARKGFAGGAAARDPDYRQRPVAARKRSGIHEREVSEMRRRCPARERYHGHVHRLVLVFLSLLRSAQLEAPRSIQPRSPTGSPSISTSAAWSTPFCT